MTSLASTATHINSTVVRFSLQTYFQILSRLHPGAARSQAERLFTTPPRHTRAYPAPAAAWRKTVLSDAGHLAVWEAGPEHAPAVLLVHGWGGVGAQMGAFVVPLLAEGRRVVWFDLPGHGQSDGRQTTLPELVRAIDAVTNTCGPFEAGIAHSLGASALALALRRGLALKRAVLIGTPGSVRDYMRQFARHLGLNAGIRDAIRNNIERRHQWRFDDIDNVADLRRVTSSVLLIHDSSDRQVPHSDSEKIAAHLRGAQLVRTFGLGHFRILGDPGVVAMASRFVAKGSPQLPEHLPELPVPAPLL